MAERRMFAKSIIDSDFFLEMSPSAQNLYFHLAMRADDDGFVNNPKSIMRITGSKDDDLRLLIAKSYVIPFESGVVVIRHWRIHNYIRKDTYNETKCVAEKSELVLNEKNEYVLRPSTGRLRGVDDSSTQDSIGKVSIGKVSIGNILPDAGQAPAPDRKVVITLITNDKSEYPVYQDQVDKWSGLYPAVDVAQELRNMKGWLDANPTRRKTKSGMLRFINNWLSKTQNQGGTKGYGRQSICQSTPTNGGDSDKFNAGGIVL